MALWGTRALLAGEDLQEKRESQEHLETEAPLEHQEPQDLRGPEAGGDSQVPGDPKVYLELREDQENLEAQVWEEDEAPMDRRASLESQESRASPDLRAPEGPRVRMAETGMDPLDPQESRATEASLDTQVSWEKMDFRDLRGFLDIKGTAAEGETQGLLAAQGVLETRDTPDTRVLEVQLESA